jgi:hypothetical protein
VNDVERLSARSTLVVYGKSSHFLPSQYDDKKETMFTDMEFEIIEKFYGEYKNKLITIRLPGGTIDGLTTFFSERPSFYEGEEAILFMNKVKDKENIYFITWFSRGKYNIHEPIKGKEKYVYCDCLSQSFGGYPSNKDVQVDPDRCILFEDFIKIIGEVFDN